MKKFLSVLLLLTLISNCLLFSSCAKKDKFSSYSFDYFDTVTSITGYENDKESFDAVSNDIMAMLEEYHRLFTIYDRYENINNLCTVNTVRNGEHEVTKVDKKIIDMLVFSKEMYEKTNGKVNVAMGSVLSIWHEYRSNGINDPTSASLPPMDILIEAAKHTDINNVIIDEEASTVYLADPLMSLDVGAIAKGYAVEMVAQALEERGIDGYVLNVGGNVRAIGKRGDGEKWTAGIDNPDGEGENAYFELLALEDMSLVTSGSYQRFYIVNGKNYNHIINSDTLMPADTFISVSVLTKSSALADALSTALFSMTYEEGAALIAETEATEAMWVLSSGEIRYSAGFSAHIYNK